MSSVRRKVGSAAAVIAVGSLLAGVPAFAHDPGTSKSPEPDLADLSVRAIEPPLTATPPATCGAGDRPETGLQGRLSPDDYTSGRAAAGFTCNTELVGSYTKPTTPLQTVPGFENTIGSVGGFKVLRYVDQAGHECAYYDTTLLFPTSIGDALTGVNVLDMSDPSNPVLATRLVTPAMLSPHESLVLSEERGILAAVTGNLAFLPGIIDIYDISQDCRNPVLRSSTPTGVLGHESGLSADGMTFYSASAGGGTLVPVDISNPLLPVPLTITGISSHGLSLSADGNRAYVASTGGEGMVIYDTSEVQSRSAAPQLHEISRLQWDTMSIPQNAIPVTIDGSPYVVEIDEFGTLSKVGAARIIDISDETNPRVVSNLRLDVHQPDNFATISGDTGAGNYVGGYSGHYCNVPRPVDPQIVACSMGLSGLRIFDISDPLNPTEAGYFNVPVTPRIVPGSPADLPPDASPWAMSSPAFVPERNEIWYSDGYHGFRAIRTTHDIWTGTRQDDDGTDPDTGGGGTGGGGDTTGGTGDGDSGGEAESGGGVGADQDAAATEAVPDVWSGHGSIPFTGLAIAGLLVCGLGLLATGALTRLGADGRRRHSAHD